MDFSARSTGENARLLVSRDGELELLVDLLKGAIAGAGSVALISGEAGIGKTALVEAITREAQSLGALVLTGACYDLTATPPYGLWRDLAGRYQRETGKSERMPAAPGFLRDHDQLEAARDQPALFERVAAFLRNLSQFSPLLIVLEDLHWADQSSLDLVRVVSRDAQSIPALMLVTHRPSPPMEQTVPLLVREAQAVRINLQPLDRSGLEALVDRHYELRHTDQQRLIEYLESRSGGNPLFVTELLRDLEVEGRLARGESGWMLGRLEDATVPALLQAMVVGRLARLPDKIRRRLLVAAVIGQDVPLDIWRRAIDISEVEMIETVDALAGAHFVIPAADGVTMEFSHALVHAAVYDTISPPRRRLLHRTIAGIMEARPRIEPNLVAWHFRQAGDDRAANWLIHAADQAQRAYAWTAAAERLIAADEMLAGAGETGQLGWIRYRIGRLRRHADPSGAGRWLERAERLGVAGGDAALVAFARFDRGHIEVLEGDYRRGLQRMIEADRLLAELEPVQITDEVAARVSDAIPRDSPLLTGGPVAGIASPGDIRRGTLVQWLVEAGRFDEAGEIGRPYVERLSNVTLLDDQRTSSLGDAWFGLGRLEAQRGDPDQAMRSLDRAHEHYRRIEHHLLMASTLRVQLAEVLIPYRASAVEQRRSIARQAEAAYQRAGGVADGALAAGFASLEQMILEGRWTESDELLESITAQPGGIVVWRHRAAALSARLALERGDPAVAWSHIATVLPDGPDTEPGSTTYVRAIELQLLAVEMALDAGDLELAESWLGALERWLDWSGASRGQAEALLARASYLAAIGDGPSARDTALFALKLAAQPRQSLALLAIHRFIGELLTPGGDTEAVRKHFEEALALAEACEAPLEVARTKLALAELQATTGVGAQASALLDEARGELQRLGAGHTLDRVDEFVSRFGPESDSVKRPFGLSAREVEVLRLVASGMTDAQVADELSISYRTVTTHLTSIFTKLNVNSRVSATRIAVERGLVRGPSGYP